ncbi:hypothetical protein DL765_000945 [Monosporascus sp. GIB2]|nr:hypothetical protein DL765_000945 [Monosporascus sp. GIB2]
MQRHQDLPPLNAHCCEVGEIDLMGISDPGKSGPRSPAVGRTLILAGYGMAVPRRMLGCKVKVLNRIMILGPHLQIPDPN